MRPGDEWPEHPFTATYHDGDDWLDWLTGYRGHGWSVPKVPPGGFPFIDPPFDRAQYGPEGTFWIFSEADMLAGLVGLPGGPTRWAVNRALRKLGVYLGAGSLLFWRVPGYVPQPEGSGMTFRWLRTTIVAKLGTTEQVAHVLNWRPRTTPDVDMSVAEVQAFGDKVRDRWADLWNGTANSAFTSWFSPQVVYDVVHTTYLQQSAPASITTHPGRRGPVKDFHYPRPDVLVPTQYSTFAVNGAKGTGTGNPLPWEVSACLSLSTGFRGPRNRGRLYLPPMIVGAMGTDGTLNSSIQAAATNFATKFVVPVQTDTNHRLMVVSRAYATALAVTGVSLGLTPDSQRRRRKKQPELKISPAAIG